VLYVIKEFILLNVISCNKNIDYRGLTVIMFASAKCLVITESCNCVYLECIVDLNCR